jgi:tetratricopeptide (TPR) repeat protein
VAREEHATVKTVIRSRRFDTVSALLTLASLFLLLTPAVHAKSKADKLVLAARDSLQRGDRQGALQYLNQALQLYQADNDRVNLAVTNNDIGRIYADLGENLKAMEYYGKAIPDLTLVWALGDKRTYCGILDNAGQASDALGVKAAALLYYTQELEGWQRLPDRVRRSPEGRTGEATALNNLGVVYGEYGDKLKALGYYTQALGLWRAGGDHTREAATLENIGHVYADSGEKQKALDYYNQALQLGLSTGDHAMESEARKKISVLSVAAAPK